MKNLFLFFILTVGALSTVNAQNSTPPAALRVEILVFSGRPNPVFTLTDPAKIDSVIAAAEALPSSETASSTTERPILGYTGIKVTNLSVDRASIQEIQVNRTGVRIHRKSSALEKGAAAARMNPPEVRHDATGALETQLLTLAREHGAIDDRLLARITKSP